MHIKYRCRKMPWAPVMDLYFQSFNDVSLCFRTFLLFRYIISARTFTFSSLTFRFASNLEVLRFFN